MRREDFQQRLTKLQLNQESLSEDEDSVSSVLRNQPPPQNQGMVRKLQHNDAIIKRLKDKLMRHIATGKNQLNLIQKQDDLIQRLNQSLQQFKHYYETVITEVETDVLKVAAEKNVCSNQLDVSFELLEDLAQEQLSQFSSREEESAPVDLPAPIEQQVVLGGEDQVKLNQKQSKSYKKFAKARQRFLDKKNFVRHTNGHKRKINIQHIDCSQLRVGKWTDLEQSLYAEFIDANRDMVDSWHLRRKEKIYIQMAEFVGTRTSQQCRSFHRQIYGDQRKIKTSENWKRENPKTEQFSSDDY